MSENPLQVRLRPLASADFDRVLELERELFGPGAWTYGMLADELAGLGRWYVVAEPDGLDALRYGFGSRPVIGYAGLWFDGDIAQVMTIGTAREYQGRGVGRALLEGLVERSRQLRASALLLEVATDNSRALALYESFGFERLGIRRRYYQPEDKDAFTMRLDLTLARNAAGGGGADAGATADSGDAVASEAAGADDGGRGDVA